MIIIKKILYNFLLISAYGYHLGLMFFVSVFYDEFPTLIILSSFIGLLLKFIFIVFNVENTIIVRTVIEVMIFGVSFSLIIQGVCKSGIEDLYYNWMHLGSFLSIVYIYVIPKNFNW